jgi:hypothetical protein
MQPSQDADVKSKALGERRLMCRGLTAVFFEKAVAGIPLLGMLGAFLGGFLQEDTFLRKGQYYQSWNREAGQTLVKLCFFRIALLNCAALPVLSTATVSKSDLSLALIITLLCKC